ncbi:uncharacterized protein LOC111271127 [Varroa jacobsoni]|uniref:uncharacterized protein LOC111271127 n=1 Tax=Varroa jacobsoni TaxID=62625 RepID=UPI000BF5DED4|nr:uncharacterized protein LOC111271127 [Varroa jacobsoni]
MRFVAGSQVTNLKFRKFDEDILCCSSQEFVDPFVLRNLRLRHAELCDLVIYLDDIFSPLAIFWHGSVVAGYCSESINLIQVSSIQRLYKELVLLIPIKFSGGRGAGISLLSKMHFLLNFIYIITNLGLVTIATSLVCECKDRSEHVVRNMLFRPQAHRRAAAHQVTGFDLTKNRAMRIKETLPKPFRTVLAHDKPGTNNCFRSRDDTVFPGQMRLLATQMAVENVQMTAFRFYSLNRSAFMTVMGAAVTYVSFVAQTAQKVTSEDE